MVARGRESRNFIFSLRKVPLRRSEVTWEHETWRCTSVRLSCSSSPFPRWPRFSLQVIDAFLIFHCFLPDLQSSHCKLAARARGGDCSSMAPPPSRCLLPPHLLHPSPFLFPPLTNKDGLLLICSVAMETLTSHRGGRPVAMETSCCRCPGSDGTALQCRQQVFFPL